MEISEMDPKIKDTQKELLRHQEKTKKFKEFKNIIIFETQIV